MHPTVLQRLRAGRHNYFYSVAKPTAQWSEFSQQRVWVSDDVGTEQFLPCGSNYTSLRQAGSSNVAKLLILSQYRLSKIYNYC
jgi:hypothetical protein